MAEKVFVRGIPDELWRSLKAGAAERGLTVSRAVAEAIRLWLAKGGGKAKGFAYTGISNLGSGGPADVSENHDRYVADAVSGGR
jgi:hypothetical protein